MSYKLIFQANQIQCSKYYILKVSYMYYENFLTSDLFWDFSSQKLFKISDVLIQTSVEFFFLSRTKCGISNSDFCFSERNEWEEKRNHFWIIWKYESWARIERGERWLIAPISTTRACVGELTPTHFLARAVAHPRASWSKIRKNAFYKTFATYCERRVIK